MKNGEYRIEKVLAQGGFGITYLAEQVALGRKVAIKEFFMEGLCNRDVETLGVSVGSVGSIKLVEGFRTKFIKEARTIAALDNNNIIRIHDVFEENGTAYYVMEYLCGKSLSAMVKEQGLMTENLALKYIRQLACALAEVHSNNLLHLDIKPANIMLNKKGEAVLIDFGISKHYDNAGKQTGSAFIGTSDGYAPIEQYETGALDNFTPATDIYALGATLFFMLTGKRPPKASEVMNYGLPALPSDISPKICDAVVAAMQPAVCKRPQSVGEFLALLENGAAMVNDDNPTIVDSSLLSKELGWEASPSSRNGEKQKKNKSNRILWIILLLLLLLIAGVGMWLAMHDNDNGSSIPQPPKLCSLTLENVPDSAKIFVDNTFMGEAPINGPIEIEPGEHTIKITKDGYEDYEKTENLSAGPQTINVSLVKCPPAPDVQDHPKGNDVKGNGKSSPKDPPLGKGGGSQVTETVGKEKKQQQERIANKLLYVSSTATIEGATYSGLSAEIKSIIAQNSDMKFTDNKEASLWRIVINASANNHADLNGKRFVSKIKVEVNIVDGNSDVVNTYVLDDFGYSTIGYNQAAENGYKDICGDIAKIVIEKCNGTRYDKE